MTNRTLIKGGLVFSGEDKQPIEQDILIEQGSVKYLGNINESTIEDAEIIDAKGKWVTPGFLDTHTHYDAEIIAQPSLSESVRHGVTTVVMGSCSISMIYNDALDSADLFTRVESVPREQVLTILEKTKSWSSTKEYVEFYKQHPLGPNMASFVGHSDLRVKVLGIERATKPGAKPTKIELQEMERLLEQGLQDGLLGLSTMTTKWDKLDGDRFRSASLPSTYASWKEFRRLNKVLRKYGRIHQGAPNIVTKWNTLLFFWESLGWFRKKLKTTLITLMDPKATPETVWLITFAARLFNSLRGDFKWQALPNVFEVYADGMDLVVFEEFGSGEAALHLQDELERNQLLQDESYRRRFRKDYDKKWGGRVWQRDFYDATIIDCPDKTLNKKTFGEVADERKLHPADLFLDLVVEFGKKLRWHTVIANHRPNVLEKIVKNQDAIISFADSGAHIRNMAYYNFPLRLLKLAKQKMDKGETDFPVHKAVYKLTGELADWFGLDAGYLEVGKRADLVIIDPQQLDQELDDYHEATMVGFGDVKRMVNRNPGIVSEVIINGKMTFQKGSVSADLGKSKEYGTFLPCQLTG